MAKKKKPDVLRNPVPHVAPKKTVVDAVLNGVLAAGNGLVTLMAGLLAGVMVLYSGYVLYDSFDTQYRAYSSAWDLLQYKPEFINDNKVPLSASQLEDINRDYRAWLTVYDTSIDYPVLQGEDDLYYAWHNIYRESSLTGAIYLAAQNSPDFSDSYNLIYGHHLDNGAMFGRLDSYRDEEFYNEHRDGIIVTATGAFDVHLFAVVNTDAYESTFYTVGDRRDQVISFLDAGGEGGVGIGTTILQYNPEDIAGAEQIVALSTCASASTSGRLVVIGTMTRRDLISVQAIGYEGVYDGEPHAASATASEEDGTIEYSVDGENWTAEPPVIQDVGEIAVRVRVTSPVYGVAEDVAFLRVTPRPVTVTARDASRRVGEADPEFTADVTGLLGEDQISYAISRQMGEEAGDYPITPAGEVLQGNYQVTYVPGTLHITAPEATDTPAPTNTPAPTEAPETTSVTIRKVWVGDKASNRPASLVMLLSGGDEVYRAVILSAANNWTATIEDLPADVEYTWIEPSVSGYTQTSETSEDGVTTVTNTWVKPATPTPGQRRSYRLTVRYHYLDGSEAAPTYTATLNRGESYSVVSPAIEGYTAVPMLVAGTMPGRNVEYTVLYVPTDALTVIEDYGTPLGFNGGFASLGECFE